MMTFQIRASTCTPRDERDVTALEKCDLPFRSLPGSFEMFQHGRRAVATFQEVSAICQIILRVPHQTHQYQPINAVVEHKGLLRGGGWFSR